MSNPLSVSATHILPIDRPPVQNGVITCSGNTISSITEGKSEHLHFDNAIILPGLVNTHCHLELGMLKGKTKEQVPFTQWADSLKELLTPLTTNNFLSAVQSGLTECLNTGTTTVIDVGFSNATIQASDTCIRLLAHKELIGMNPIAAETIFDAALKDLDQATSTALLTQRLSAHAPFSCSPDLIKKIINYSSIKSSPFIMHLAESLEEQEHYSKIQGGMLDFLRTRWSSYTPPLPAKNSVDYCLDNELIPERSLLVHCNTITPEQLTVLFQKKCTISHCPRSRAFFGHPQFPLKEALGENVPIALGTDSLASNYSLNMWEELQHLYSEYENIISPEECIKMATMHGAKATGIPQLTGTLTKDALADFIVVEPTQLSDDPYADLISGTPKVLLSVVNGSIAYKAAP